MTRVDAPDLSIVIVSYNTRVLSLDCLRSVFETADDVTFELTLVDNHSHDGTVEAVRELYPTVQLIVNRQNEGFAKAVNQALRISRGRYLLMLNSDARLQAHALGHMMACLDREADIGAVGCKQRTEEGRMYQSCFHFPSVRDHLLYVSLFRRCAPALQRALASRQIIDCAQSQDVDWINGACLMVRRDLLEACGGLDEGYFMYFEDIDLCRAIRARGYRIRHVAEADVIHLIGRSGTHCRARLNLVWELSRIRYVDKYFPWYTRWMMKSWIVGGAFVRLLRALVRSRSIVDNPSWGASLVIIAQAVLRKPLTSSQLIWAEEGRG